MIFANLLWQKINTITEYVRLNADVTCKDVEEYYEFCYDVLVGCRERGDGYGSTELELDIARLHVGLYELVFGKAFNRRN